MGLFGSFVTKASVSWSYTAAFLPWENNWSGSWWALWGVPHVWALPAQDQLSVSLYLPAGGNAGNTMTAKSTPELCCARCTTETRDVTEAQAVPCSSSNSLFFFFFLLLFSVETVNDGQFHSVELVMLNQTLNLVVDKGAPKSLGKLQKQSSVSLNTPLYIGGTVNCSGIEVLTCFFRSKSSSILWRGLSHSHCKNSPLGISEASRIGWHQGVMARVEVSVGVSQIVITKKQINNQQV